MCFILGATSDTVTCLWTTVTTLALTREEARCRTTKP